jgi:hypothetical protein
MKKNILKRRRVVMATIGSLGDLHPYTPGDLCHLRAGSEAGQMGEGRTHT